MKRKIKNKIVTHEKRIRIYNFIKKNPGLHLREISRNLDIPRSTLKHHLGYFEKNDLISEEKFDNFNRYFINTKIEPKEKVLLSALRQKAAAKILVFFLVYYCDEKDYFSIYDIKNMENRWENIDKNQYKLPNSHKTLYLQLENLTKIGLLEKKKDKNINKYKLVDKLYFIRVIYKNIDYFENIDLKEGTNYIKESTSLYLDNIIESLSEIFPFPLSSYK